MRENKIWNPDTVAGPFGTYSLCCDVPAGARLLSVAGQVGVMPDGTLADGVEAQSEWALRNIVAILAANDMQPTNIIKLGIFLLDPAHVPVYRGARQKVLGDIQPPGTLLVVAGLANPNWLVELEAYAAKV